MIVRLRAKGRWLLRVAAGLGAVLCSASPLREPSSAPAPRQAVQSSPPPAAVSVPAGFCAETPVPWNVPLVATTAVPNDPSPSAGVRLDDSVAIPEPSVILLLLGGAGIAIVLRRSPRAR
ncbi:MAG: PEP-CTERM sorting domain-containing protein [Phycisphaerae bacterium]